MLRSLGFDFGCALIDYLSTGVRNTSSILVMVRKIEELNTEEKRKVLITSLLPLYIFLTLPDHLLHSYNLLQL